MKRKIFILSVHLLFCVNIFAQSAKGGLFHSVILCGDGKIFATGSNTNGQLGNNTVVGTSLTPVQVSGINNAIAVSAGTFSSYALLADSTIQSWGENNYGQLGDGTNTDQALPVTVNNLPKITAFSSGEIHVLALSADSTVWAWGYNQDGQLGNGNTVNSNVPVQVGGFGKIISVSAGRYHNLALKDDSTVWAWGKNQNGQLGDGTTVDKYTPVKVTGLSAIIAVSAGRQYSLALRNDGTVWAWGFNSKGQLGDGTNTETHIPVQVSGLANIINIEASEYYHSLALRNDGRLWAWGQNNYGQLGDGTNTDRNTPVQVSGLTGITEISTGSFHSIALRNDGKAWAWGWNTSGTLGDATIMNKTTPVLVGMPCLLSLSTEEQEAGGEDFFIYPVVSNGEFMIHCASGINYDIEIYNILGEIVYLEQGMQQSSYLLSSQLPAGKYLVQLRTNSGSVVKKIIITE